MNRASAAAVSAVQGYRSFCDVESLKAAVKERVRALSWQRLRMSIFLRFLDAARSADVGIPGQARVYPADSNYTSNGNSTKGVVNGMARHEKVLGLINNQ